MAMEKYESSLPLSAELVNCVCKEEVDLETIVVGFPGPGLVGSIAAKYLSSELDLKPVGFIRSPLIPPVAVFFEGFLAYPYRIHADSEKKIGVLIGESPSPPNAYYHIANAVLDWAERNGVREVVIFGGFPVRNLAEEDEEKPRVFLVAEPALREKVKDFDLPLLHGGYISDLAGAILNEAIIRDNIDGYALLVPTVPNLPDPRGASQLVKTLTEMKGFDVNLKPLLEDSEKIKDNLEEIAQHSHELQTHAAVPEPRRGLYT
ncbi:MAG: proteasome assembly chaperone family protein [Candidatus Hodarchaeales archaeon]|jgi:uncharacterized protein